MKKLFIVLALAALASCNNAADTEKRAKDSLDSINKLQNKSVDEAAKGAKQTNDSLTEKKKDSVDAMHKGTDSAAHK